MKLKLAVLGLLLTVTSTLLAQSAGTDTWSNTTAPGGVGGACNIHPPENAPTRTWYCFYSVLDSQGTGDVSTLTIYVTVQPDNTFTNGLITKSPLDGTADSFTSGNYSGTFTPDPTSVANGTFVGTFSGTTTNGVAFTGQNTETIGKGFRACGVGAKCPTNGRVVAASGSVTFTPTSDQLVGGGTGGGGSH